MLTFVVIAFSRGFPYAFHVPGTQDFQAIVSDAIDEQVRRAAYYPFARFRSSSAASDMRMVAQPSRRVPKLLCYALRCNWIILCNIGLSLYKIGECRMSPPNPQPLLPIV